MEDWKKGSYYFPEMPDQQGELEILKQNSASASKLEALIWQGLNLGDNANVMDLGCGPGFISMQLAKFLPFGKVLGVDVSQKLIDYAEKEREKQGIKNLRFTQNDIYELDLLEKTFDLIYSRFVFQHLTCPVEALKSASLALTSGGLICIVDIDDSNISMFPDHSAYNSFIRRSGDGQSKKGGDREIGEKLTHFFREAGMENINEQIITISSSEIGMKTFLDITTKFKMPNIPEVEYDEAMKELEQIYVISDNSDAYGTLGIYVVTGEKGLTI